MITYETDMRCTERSRSDRRVIKKVDGEVVRRYVYQDELNISQELDAQGNVETQYIYGLRANIPEYMVRGGVEYKIISDHLGSPVMIVNTRDNSVVKSIKYDTFGRVISDSAPSFSLPFRFAGGIYDEDTKLIRFGVRDYDSETGRWTSKEPLGFSATNNFYAYCDNKPVNFVDVDGNAKDSVTAQVEQAFAKGNLKYLEEIVDSIPNKQTQNLAKYCIKKLKSTPNEIIRLDKRKGKILKEIVGELKNKTLKEIMDLARIKGPLQSKARSAKKLLMDKRFLTGSSKKLY